MDFAGGQFWQKTKAQDEKARGVEEGAFNGARIRTQ
jgi:hypothetical protein